MPKRKEADTQPWEQQPGESSKAFEAFATYRNLGPERSIQKTSQKLSKNMTTLKGWSRKWSWVERSRAYDREMDKQAHAQAVREVRQMTNRHIRIAMNLQAKALRALETMDEEQLTPKMTLAFLKEATKLERMNRLDAAGIGEDDKKDGEVEIVIEGEEDDADGQG